MRARSTSRRIGRHVCGMVTTNAGCRRRRKERKRQRVGVSKMKGRGAGNALRIWIRGEWGGRQQARGVRTSSFSLREGSSREEIGKWLKNKSIPWQRRRRLLTSADPAGYATVWRQRVNSDTQQSTQNDSDNSFVRSVTAEWDEEREGLFHTATRSRVAGRNRLGHKDLS